jgi:hypothetical protein
MRVTTRRRGFSTLALVCIIGVIVLCAVSITIIVAAIAVPKMNRQLMVARESAAIVEIRTIHQAEALYYSQFGKYARSIAALGPSANGVAGPEAADLIPRALADGKKAGYVFELKGTTKLYSISAVPEVFGASGLRSFYSDQTLVIRQNYTAEPANANSPELK